MAESQPSAAGAISLDELIALNDEIAALVRAGVPLDRGLWRLGGDLGGRLGRLAARLGEGLGRGESLAAALGGSDAGFPPFYCAVVEAGARTGRLAAALETVAGGTRRLADARRMVVASMIYPRLFFCSPGALFVLFVSRIAAALLTVFEWAPVPAPRLLEAFVFLRASVAYRGPAVPIAAVFAFGWWWHRASCGTLAERHRRLLLGGTLAGADGSRVSPSGVRGAARLAGRTRLAAAGGDPAGGRGDRQREDAALGGTGCRRNRAGRETRGHDPA